MSPDQRQRSDASPSTGKRTFDRHEPQTWKSRPGAFFFSFRFSWASSDFFFNLRRRFFRPVTQRHFMYAFPSQAFPFSFRSPPWALPIPCFRNTPLAVVDKGGYLWERVGFVHAVFDSDVLGRSQRGRCCQCQRRRVPVPGDRTSARARGRMAAANAGKSRRRGIGGRGSMAHFPTQGRG